MFRTGQPFVFAVLFASTLIPTARAEEPPAHSNRYSLTVRLHLETQLPRLARIGAKQYMQPVDTTLDGTARFVLAQKLWASAEGDRREVRVEEVSVEPVRANPDVESSSLRVAFEQLLTGWRGLQGQVYNSRRAAGWRVWPVALHLSLEEELPRYLTAWLDEALQAVPLADWAGKDRAWSRTQPGMEAPDRNFNSDEPRRESFRGEPIQVLTSTSLLSGRRPTSELPPDLRAQGITVSLSFLATDEDSISALDQRLVRAVRTATRHTTWTLPKKGGIRPPMFDARLACSVLIEELE